MELSEGVIKRDPLVLGADFWRMCAKADVEIARTDFTLLEPPFVADEGAAAVELAKAEAAAKRRAIQHTLVAKRKQAEAAKKAVEKKAAKIKRAEDRKLAARMEGFASDSEEDFFSSDSDEDDGDVSKDTRGQLSKEDEASFADSFQKVDDLRADAAVEAKAQEAALEAAHT